MYPCIYSFHSLKSKGVLDFLNVRLLIITPANKAEEGGYVGITRKQS